MNKFLMTLPLIGLMAGCGGYGGLNEGQVLGTTTGAVIGAAVTPNDRTQGALLGAAAGLVATSLVGTTASGECVYRRQDGTQFVGPC
jgi:hypothetical protein